MDDSQLDPERRSWEDADAACADLPAQLRVLQRMVAAANARLEEITDRLATESADYDRPGLDDR